MYNLLFQCLRMLVSNISSSVKTLPRYLNIGTCPTFVFSIRSFHLGMSLSFTTMHSVFLLLILNPFVSVLFKTFSKNSWFFYFFLFIYFFLSLASTLCHLKNLIFFFKLILPMIIMDPATNPNSPRIAFCKGGICPVKRHMFDVRVFFLFCFSVFTEFIFLSACS